MKNITQLKKFELPDNESIENYFQNMNCFPWMNLISVLISNIDIIIPHP